MKKITRFALLVACCAVFTSAIIATSVFGIQTVKGDSETTGGTTTTVAVTDASTLFESWNNDTATYGVNKNGAWRKDNCTTGNRQIPIKQALTISKTKDAYLKFALPVYDSEGALMADKSAEEIILHVINNRNEEMWLKFYSGDNDHATGVNYCVGKVQLTGVEEKDSWRSYWCYTRIPGDFTATNFIGIKFADKAGENISMLKADGTWYADPNMNEADGARTDVTSFFADATSLKLNFTYWGEGKDENTNLELVLHDFDGTVYTDQISTGEEIAIGGEKTTVEVADSSTLFENWNNDTATYGVNKNGAWRKDSFAGSGNRQIPIKQKLTISDTKDAYLQFALPVYGSDGALLSDKVAAEVIFVLTNDNGEEFQIKFLTGDKDHANGINYCVSKTPAGGWVGYWCSARIAGDFTADNLIGLKFSKRAGESIAMLKPDGTWYADPNMNEADGARTDVTSFFNTTTLKINVMYWADKVTSDTNIELLLHDFDGTVYTDQIPTEDGYIGLHDKFTEVTFNGKTVTVPEGKGYFGEEEVDATVTVTDANSDEVTLTEGAFTALTGVYTVYYKATYKNGKAELTKTITVYSGEKVMDVPTDADNYFRGWISGGSYWNQDGLTSIDNSGYDVEKGHQRQSCYQADYNIEGDNTATLQVSIPIYDEDGNRLPNRLNRAENGIDWLDIIVIDLDTNYEFRLRMIDNYSAKEETTFFGAFFSRDPYASDANYGGWIDRPANVKMRGTFTQSSSFSFSFGSKENEHMKVIAPDGTWKVVGAADGVDDEHNLTKALNTFFAGVKNIQVNFYYWASPKYCTENDNLAVTYKSINGQSFVPVDGKIADETAPVVGAVVAPANTKLFRTGSNYVFGISYVNEIFENVDARAIVYRKKGTTEWKSTGKIDKDAKGNKIVGVNFEDAGVIEVAAKAVDYVGNVGIGPVTEINVEKGYDIVINGEVPARGEIGKKITLPAATATDKNGVTRTVTISVDDSSSMPYAMDDATSFTPNKAGIYYINYKSEYVDETTGKKVSTTQTFNIIVSAGSSSGGSSSGKKDGCNSSVNTAAMLASLMLLSGVVFVIRKKRV